MKPIADLIGTHRFVTDALIQKVQSGELRILDYVLLESVEKRERYIGWCRMEGRPICEDSAIEFEKLEEKDICDYAGVFI